MKLKDRLLLLFALLIFLLSGCSGDVKEVKGDMDYPVVSDKEDFEELIRYRNEKVRERFKNRRLTITAVGDIMLGRGVGSRLNSDLELAYKNLLGEFNKADILFGNLENPISNRGEKMPGKGICLRAKPEMVEVLKEAGFDVLSLANNHILDYGDEAILDTFEILEENNIGYVGAGRNIHEARSPYIIELKNKTIGFLAYDNFYDIYYSSQYKRKFVATEDLPGTAPLKEEIILEDIKELRDKVDILILSFHWGVEESNYVTEEQRRLAHKLIDNGADIILGHHPHVIQGIEIYNDKPIIYSLGNYIFDQNDENNKQGMVVNIILKENRDVDRIEALPIYIKDKREPIIPTGEMGKNIREKILRLSKSLGTEGTVEGEKVVFLVKPYP